MVPTSKDQDQESAQHNAATMATMNNHNDGIVNDINQNNTNNHNDHDDANESLKLHESNEGIVRKSKPIIHSKTGGHFSDYHHHYHPHNSRRSVEETFMNSSMMYEMKSDDNFIVDKNQPSIQELVFPRVAKCNLYISKKNSKSKIKGTCSLYRRIIIFHPKNSESDRLEIIIREIENIKFQRSHKIGESRVVRIQTRDEVLIFTHWDQAMRQLLYSYWVEQCNIRSSGQNYTPKFINKTYKDTFVSEMDPQDVNAIDVTPITMDLSVSQINERQNDVSKSLPINLKQIHKTLVDHYLQKYQCYANMTLDMNIEQFFNCIFDDSFIYRNIRDSSEEICVEFSGWKIDDKGCITNNMVVNPKLKFFKNIETLIQQELIWPYIEGQLLVVKSSIFTKNIPSIKSISISTIHLVIYDSNLNQSNVQILMNIDVRGNSITSAAIKKAATSAFVKRTNLAFKILKDSYQLINAQEYRILKLPSIPDQIKYNETSFQSNINQWNSTASNNSSYSGLCSADNINSDSLQNDLLSDNIDHVPNDNDHNPIQGVSDIQNFLSVNYRSLCIIILIILITLIYKLYKKFRSKIQLILHLIHKIELIDENLKKVMNTVNIVPD